MKLKKNVSALIVMSVFATTTIPQGLHAETWKEHKVTVKPSSEKIADVFNKFRYEMTVEWDQRDPSFKEYAEKQLATSLAALKKEGVSETAILAYMNKNILDENARKDYDRLITALVKQNLHENEAAKVAMNYMEKNHQQGVGFSGGGSTSYSKVMLIVGIIIVGVVTCMLVKGKKKPGNETGSNGHTGDTGYNGDTGHSGYNGNNGSSGHSGYNGSNGSSGHSGYNGSNGSSGHSGYNGSNGSSGHSGYNGSSGHSGYNGNSGHSGWNGSAGTI